MADPIALVVILPGIGGTVLAEASVGGGLALDSSGQPVVVWSANLRDATLLAHPDRLSLAERPHLVPVGLLPTRKPFGLFTAIQGYEGLIKRVASAVPDAVVDNGRNAPDLDATVVAIGYDFRRSVKEAAEHLDRQLQPRLEHLWPVPGDRRSRVVFVAHSMGGLVARYWTARHSAGQVRAIITLGTPHRGSPKALDVMANGYPVGPFHLSLAKDLAREWPGMADLLPRYPVIASSQVPLGEGQGELLRPHEAGIDWLNAPAASSWQMHQDIATGWAGLDTPPEVVPRIGFGHRTLRSARWDGHRLRVETQSPGEDAPAYWSQDLGDGTVPAVAALPVEMDNVRPQGFRVPAKHGPMADLDVGDLLREYLDIPAVGLAYRDPNQPVVSLGLDVDDARPTGDPIPVEVSVWQNDATTSAPVVLDPRTAGSVRVAVAAVEGGGLTAETILGWDVTTGRFVGEVPGLAPGVYDVRVAAKTLTDSPPTHVLEVIGDVD